MKFLLTVLCSLLLAGCVTSTNNAPTTNNLSLLTTGDLSFLTSNTRYFAIHPAISKAYVTDDIDSTKLMSQFETAITEQMVNKGYQQVSYTQSPDVLIGFGIATESQLSDERILSKVGLSAGLIMEGVDTTKYEKGSVVIALFAPNQQLPRWKALAQGLTKQDRSNDIKQERINRVIRSMLKSVPSK